MTADDFNASQAAKRIGISDRTIRRWLMPDRHGKIKLASVKGDDGQIKIAASDVERLRTEVKRTRVRQAAKPVYDTPARHDIDSLTARITELESLVASQEQQIIDAACRISTLELTNFLASTLERPATPPVPSETTQDISLPKVAQNRDTELLGGTLSASSFAAKLGISYEQLKNYMRRGVNSEHLEITEIKHPTRAGYMQKYFTYEQQQKALAILKRHGKLPDI